MDKLGFGLVEIVIASAIISVSIFSLSAVSVIGNRLQSQSLERKITVENVFRDSNDNIDLSGGTQDPDTKKVSISVSWRDRNATTTINLSTYLSDIFDN